MSRTGYPDPKPALDFILNQHRLGVKECYKLPTDQKRVYYLGAQHTPQWVATCMEYGPPGLGDVPVRACKTRGCINGQHHRWGGQSDANKTRVMPIQSGENNPGAKLTAVEVAQLRSVKWGGGYFKRHAAEAAGISMRTLKMIIDGGTWRDVEPYRGAAEWAGRGKEDEF